MRPESRESSVDCNDRGDYCSEKPHAGVGYLLPGGAVAMPGAMPAPLAQALPCGLNPGRARSSARIDTGVGSDDPLRFHSCQIYAETAYQRLALRMTARG